MIRYRANPDGGARIVEASPEDIRSMRRFVRTVLWKMGIAEEDAKDLYQTVDFITWKAIQEGGIRQHQHENAFFCLRAWMQETAWRTAMNERARRHHRFELRIEADLPIEQDARLDARELLARLRVYPEIVALLLGLTSQTPTIPGPIRQRAHKARRWLRDVRESGVWREPPGYEKPRPRDRKKKR